MEMTQKKADLICALEELIGKECYNASSTNGYTGEVGKWFRYRVHYDNVQNEDDYTKYTVRNMTPDRVSTMKYMFGSNHLYIGLGLAKVLEYLEENYNLDFDKLHNVNAWSRTPSQKDDDDNEWL